MSMEVINFGPLKLNLSSRKFFVLDQEIFLRSKEFSLMEYFLKNSGKVVSRTEILEDVWDRNICCSTNTIDVHVSSLRKKISDSKIGSTIRTVHCHGYILE